CKLTLLFFGHYYKVVRLLIAPRRSQEISPPSFCLLVAALLQVLFVQPVCSKIADLLRDAKLGKSSLAFPLADILPSFQPHHDELPLLQREKAFGTVLRQSPLHPDFLLAILSFPDPNPSPQLFLY